MQAPEQRNKGTRVPESRDTEDEIIKPISRWYQIDRSSSSRPPFTHQLAMQIRILGRCKLRPRPRDQCNVTSCTQGSGETCNKNPVVFIIKKNLVFHGTLLFSSRRGGRCGLELLLGDAKGVSFKIVRAEKKRKEH